ncbi:unnamed protein product [Rhizopus stolonifer]
MRSTILSRYNGTSINAYKGLWKQAFKKAVDQLSLPIDTENREDLWDYFIVQHIKEKAPTKSDSVTSGSNPTNKSCNSTSSLLYQRKLTPVDYSNIFANFAKITKKWKLKSGKMIEDIMFKASKDFVVEHPAHSFILNVMDPVWKECFSQSEFDEIKSEESIIKFNKPFPSDLQELILKLDKKTNFRDMYDAIDAVKAHPLDDPEKFWLKQSILDYLMLFSNDTTLASSEIEKDLLDDIYGFVKKSCKLSGTKTHGAKQSKASSVSKNADRTIGSSSTVQRKHTAENADLTFRHFSHELCCLEIGLNDCGPNDTKEMNESSIKTPIMMKNFCAHLISQYKMEPKNIKIMGIIISGLNIKALGMTFDKGSVSLLSTSDRLHMPESVSEVPRLLPPALRLVYNLNKFLKSTVDELKVVNSSISCDLDDNFFFPPCFVPAAATSVNKRKRKENN